MLPKFFILKLNVCFNAHITLNINSSSFLPLILHSCSNCSHFHYNFDEVYSHFNCKILTALIFNTFWCTKTIPNTLEWIIYSEFRIYSPSILWIHWLQVSEKWTCFLKFQSYHMKMFISTAVAQRFVESHIYDISRRRNVWVNIN